MIPMEMPVRKSFPSAPATPKPASFYQSLIDRVNSLGVNSSPVGEKKTERSAPTGSVADAQRTVQDARRRVSELNDNMVKESRTGAGTRTEFLQKELDKAKTELTTAERRLDRAQREAENSSPVGIAKNVALAVGAPIAGIAAGKAMATGYTAKHLAAVAARNVQLQAVADQIDTVLAKGSPATQGARLRGLVKAADRLRLGNSRGAMALGIGGTLLAEAAVLRATANPEQQGETAAKLQTALGMGVAFTATSLVSSRVFANNTLATQLDAKALATVEAARELGKSGDFAKEARSVQTTPARPKPAVSQVAQQSVVSTSSSMAELRTEAKRLGITGTAKLRAKDKAALVKQIEAARGAPGVSAPAPASPVAAAKKSSIGYKGNAILIGAMAAGAGLLAMSQAAKADKPISDVLAAGAENFADGVTMGGTSTYRERRQAGDGVVVAGARAVLGTVDSVALFGAGQGIKTAVDTGRYYNTPEGKAAAARLQKQFDADISNQATSLANNSPFAVGMLGAPAPPRAYLNDAARDKASTAPAQSVASSGGSSAATSGGESKAPPPSASDKKQFESNAKSNTFLGLAGISALTAVAGAVLAGGAAATGRFGAAAKYAGLAALGSAATGSNIKSALDAARVKEDQGKISTPRPRAYLNDAARDKASASPAKSGGSAGSSSAAMTGGGKVTYTTVDGRSVTTTKARAAAYRKRRDS